MAAFVYRLTHRIVPQLVLYNLYKKMLTPLPQMGIICRRR